MLEETSLPTEPQPLPMFGLLTMGILLLKGLFIGIFVLGEFWETHNQKLVKEMLSTR